MNSAANTFTQTSLEFPVDFVLSMRSTDERETRETNEDHAIKRIYTENILKGFNIQQRLDYICLKHCIIATATHIPHIQT